jgi:hypothetical protein
MRKTLQMVGVLGFFGIVLTTAMLGAVAHGVKSVCSGS